MIDMEEKVPVLHRHAEFLEDRKEGGFISDKIMMKWFNDRYSTSKHLLILYSLAKGLNAKNILEIGGGRSTSVLARASYENKGKLVHCDTIDINSLLSEEERRVTRFYLGNSDQIWGIDEGYDFAFLDYFSDENLKTTEIKKQIDLCITKIKTNGIIFIHDAFIPKYKNIQEAIKKLIKRREIEYFVIPFNYGLGMIRYLGSSPYGSCDCQYHSSKKPKIKYVQGS